MRPVAIVLFFAAAAGAQPVRTCESLTSVSLPNTTIESAVTEPSANNRPAFCRITAVTTHPPAGDHVRIFIGLPLTGWNGRFEGVGGGGFRAAAPMAWSGRWAKGTPPGPPTRATTVEAPASRWIPRAIWTGC